MNFALSADRFKTWIAIVLLTAVAAASFWMLEIVRKGDAVEGMKASSTPDYYVEKFDIVKRAEKSTSGQPNISYHLTGDRLSHFPSNDQIHIEQPRLQSFQGNQVHLNIQALRAVILSKSAVTEPKRDSDEVHLYENVELVRPQSADAEYMQVQTDYLLLLPDSDIIKTDKPIVLRTAHSEARAIGMVANNATQRLDLLHKVHIKFRKPGTSSAL